jgi:hypothetical protein
MGSDRIPSIGRQSYRVLCSATMHRFATCDVGDGFRITAIYIRGSGKGSSLMSALRPTHASACLAGGRNSRPRRSISFCTGRTRQYELAGQQYRGVLTVKI